MNNTGYANFDALEREGKFRKTLQLFGFPKMQPLRTKTFMAVVALVSIGVVFLVVSQLPGLTNEKSFGAAASVTTAGFAFWYWQSARYEASMDRYYDRLNLANTRYEKLSPDKYLMYMFMELDNLEYVIEKYKWGYITAEQAFRGLKLFYTHCREIKEDVQGAGKVPLNELASIWVGNGGYLTTTCHVVTHVCDEIANVKSNEEQRQLHGGIRGNPPGAGKKRSAARWIGAASVVTLALVAAAASARAAD
jgi:hypothetical protein